MTGVRCMLMRGGTSKGLYFLASDLPDRPEQRDELLLAIMGSGNPLQIDGLGGAHPLTSKVAVVSASQREDADVDYLFLQLGVEHATITDQQNCGNILAGVGPFAVERGLIAAGAGPGTDQTTTRIAMVNSGSVVTASFPTPGGTPLYVGTTSIAGVPGTAAAVTLRFADTAGSTTGHLLPTGNVRDMIGGIEVTCVDNGMPVVVARASDLGITGHESVDQLASDTGLIARVHDLRLAAGRLMGLGDVSELSVPKTTLVSAPRDGGTICTRTFIPERLHTSIGVLGAVTVATALRLPGGVGTDLASTDLASTDLASTDLASTDLASTGLASTDLASTDLAEFPPTGHVVDVEHPTGHLDVEVELDLSANPPNVISAGVIRTARKLFDGTVFPAQQ